MVDCKIVSTIKTVTFGNESDLCDAVRNGDIATLKRDFADALIESLGFNSVDVVGLQIIKLNEQETQ